MHTAEKDLSNLPEDSASLKAMLRSLLAERDREKQRADEQLKRADDLHIQNLRLQLELARYKKWYYGPRADRLNSTSELAQVLLDFGQELEQRPIHPEDVPAASEPEYELRRVKRRKGRRSLANFENLPVTTQVYELSAEERTCPGCGVVRQESGAEESWQIEYIPGHFERIHHVRKKYACVKCERTGEAPQMTVAARPESPIDKGMAGPGLLAYIVACKFADYLPLYRMAERVRQSHVVATDDTILPMLSPGKTKRARMWVYVGDPDHPYNVFDFTLDRGRDGPKQFLKDYTQVLLADAYGGYDGVVAGNAITRAGCWSHARRKVVDAEKTAPEIAREVVALLRPLFAIENQAREASASERLEIRQKQSVPVLAELRQKLLVWKEQLIPQHPMADAVNYTLNHWTELNVFCSDGTVPIDNNASEREMKRVVLNRKNSLFVGNPRGGRTFATLASLTSTCRRHQIDPQLYLTQLLMNLPQTKLSELDEIQ